MNKLIAFGVLIILSLPIHVHGLELQYPEFGGIAPNGDITFVSFISWLYYGIITVAAFAAFGVIVWGGIEYLTSAGNPSKMQSGMNRIQDAIIGILIVLISYLILQTINPELINLPDL